MLNFPEPSQDATPFIAPLVKVPIGGRGGLIPAKKKLVSSTSEPYQNPGGLVGSTTTTTSPFSSLT